MFDYEKWIGEQSEETKAGLEEHYKGILNSVKATREERDNLDKQLKKLAKNMEDGSDAQQTILEMRNKLAGETKRANFFEMATKQGVKNTRVAYALANSDNLYSEDGNPDWDKIKETAPELFNAQSINSDAGSGTNQKPVGNVNKTIRESLSKGEIRIKT